MSNDKEIKIRAVLSTESFDQGIREIQQKLSRITQQQNQGAGTQKALGKDNVLGKYAQQAFGDFSKESQKQMEDMFRSQRSEAMQQALNLRGKQAELAKVGKIDGEMTRQQKERVEMLKKEIDLLKEKQRITLNTAAETQKAIDKMKPAAGGGGAGGGGNGGDPAPPGDSGGGAATEMFKKYLKQMTTAAGAAAIYKGALNAASDYIGRERVIGANNAASYNMGSREMRESFGGRGSRGMFYLPERQRAMRMAATEQGRQSTLDLVGAGGSALAGGLAGAYAGMQGGAMAGAYGGAAVGGLFGGVGALPGSVIGAGLGAIGGAIGGGYLGMQATTSERQRARLFDKEKYSSIMNKEGMEKYEQNLASEKAKDPRRAMAQEYFEQNRQDIAANQKLLGVNSDSEYMGSGGLGLLQRNMKAGGQFGGVNFNQQTIQDQMHALASGGAMTDGIQGMSGQAATYNRQFNLSNAGQTMGRMQGNTGQNSSLTDLAYQRLLAEAVRHGVDASTMPRELEKMTQMTAELTTAGGVEAAGMGDLFGAGLSGFNQKAMSSAAGAAQNFASTAKEAGGWEGQMGMGYLQSGAAKSLLGGKSLSAKDMNYINQMSAADMSESDFQRVGEYLGIDASSAKKLIQEKDKTKQGRTAGEDKAYADLGEFLKGKSPTEAAEAIKSGAGGKLFAEAESIRGQTHGDFMGKDRSARQAEILLQANVAAGNEPAIDYATAADKVAGVKSRKENRGAYVEEGAEATGDMTRMDALNEQLDNLKNAARNHTKYAEEYNKQFELMVNATKAGATAMEDVATQLEQLDKRIREENAASGVPGAKPPQ
jgi:hypothetical protein